MSEQEQEKKQQEEEEEETKEKEEIIAKAEIAREPAIESKHQQMWDRLNNQANEESQQFFEHLMASDEFEFNGKTYRYNMINRKNMGELVRLRTEGIDLDKTNDFESYSENIMKRACIVIDGMTREKFDTDDYDLLETITVAWSLKDRGFRQYLKSVKRIL